MLVHLGLVGWCLVLVGCWLVLGQLLSRCHCVHPLPCPPSCLSSMSSPITSASSKSTPESETKQTIPNTVLKCPPTSRFNFTFKHLPVVITIFKRYSVVSEASEVGGADSSRRRTRRFCEICDLKTMIVRRTRTHSWRWLKCLKSDRRNGKYAAMCLVSGDEGCLVVMVLVGFSVVGLLVASGPSGSLPALDWYLLVLVVLVDHSGVPVLAGHFLCEWCFPIYVYQHQYLLSCYPTVAL